MQTHSNLVLRENCFNLKTERGSQLDVVTVWKLKNVLFERKSA